MVKLLNNKEDILNKVDEIINYIKKSKTYLEYEELMIKIKDNKEINTLIESIKKYQKRIVNHPDEEKILDLKIKECIDELESYPLYIAFINTQSDLNNMINIFESRINNYFFDVFN